MKVYILGFQVARLAVTDACKLPASDCHYSFQSHSMMVGANVRSS